MARRTKEDAEATRHKLLDAAQAVFYERGVAGASLAEVAKAANLSRGAIYWHFQNKADLFNAMIQRVTLPFERALEIGEEMSVREGVALSVILGALRLVLHSVSTDEGTRTVFDIAVHKTECVGEMLAVRERRVLEASRFTKQMERMLSLAAVEQQITLPVQVASAAHGLHAVFCGVLHAWLLYPEAPFPLEEEGMLVVSLYLKGLGFSIRKEIS